MSNLFSAGLYRLRKSKVFWLALIFMAVISVILCVEMARNAVTDPNITFADGMFSNDGGFCHAVSRNGVQRPDHPE